MPEFKFLDRGKKKTAVLLHGWAADHRIFATADLEFNYLLPVGLSPSSFASDLFGAMEKRGLGKISIIAWSMGCFTACDFLKANSGVVDETVLIGARRKYPENSIREIKELIGRNKKAFLRKFYSDCFSRTERDEYSWFKNNLLGSYLDEMETNSLIEGLDYISQSKIEPGVLGGLNLNFIHGTDDRIAPFDEALKLKDEFSHGVGFFPMKDAGHMPFLRADFKKDFCPAAKQTGRDVATTERNPGL